MGDSVLLIGRQGQVGQALQAVGIQQLFQAKSSQVKSYQAKSSQVRPITLWGRAELDLSEPDTILPAIQQLQPQVIINAAAYTGVDRAEQEPELAFLVNGEAPRQLAIAAQTCGATLIHLSTDYVFNGRQSHPYQETDATDPLGVYGRSKLAGEEGIREHCDRHIILRTAWVYSASDKPNFVKTMLRLGRERSEVRVVSDQIGSPTWAEDLAGAIVQLITLGAEPVSSPLPEDSIYGTYHFTNSGVASWYDFAVAIFEEAENQGCSLALQRVVPIPTIDYPTPAQRPAYSVLNCGKIISRLGTPPPHWRQSLRRMLPAILPALINPG